MKAAIYLGKENIEIQELPIPQLGDYDVLIKKFVEQMLRFISTERTQDIVLQLVRNLVMRLYHVLLQLVIKSLNFQSVNVYIRTHFFRQVIPVVQVLSEDFQNILRFLMQKETTLYI